MELVRQSAQTLLLRMPTPLSVLDVRVLAAVVHL